MEEQKDFTTELLENMEKALSTATMIKEKTVGIPFTLIKLSQLTRISFDECRQKINFIGTYHLVKKEKKNGVELFSIVLNPQARILALEKDKQSFVSQISFINAIQQVVQGEIEDNTNGVSPLGTMKMIEDEESEETLSDRLAEKEQEEYLAEQK